MGIQNGLARLWRDVWTKDIGALDRDEWRSWNPGGKAVYVMVFAAIFIPALVGLKLLAGYLWRAWMGY